MTNWAPTPVGALLFSKMTTDEQLEAEIAEMRKQREIEREIEKLLQLDEEQVKLIHVKHKTHRSLLVKSRSDRNLWKLEGEELLDVLKKVRPWTVAAERVKSPSFSPTWMPLSINYSNDKGQGKVIGLATVNLRQHGGKGFSSRTVSVWLDLGPLGYLDAQCDVNIPWSWQGHNSIHSFCGTTGDPSRTTAVPPKAELPGQELYWNRTTKGTYDLHAYWETLEGFITDWWTLR